MRKVSLVLLGLVFAVWSSPAGAQAARTWVSGTGLDTNPCTRAAPCATFAVAFAATLTGGEISVVDSGAYGSLTINKAISITNDGAGEAGIVVSSTNAIIINAGTADVNLRGLVLNGQGSGLGIHILAAGRVSVQNCLIQQFGTGINVATNANNIKLHIQDTTIINSTNGFSIQPGPGIIAHVVVDRSRFSSNTGMGVNANGAFGGSIQIAVTNSVMSNNQHGFVANGGSGGTVRGMVSDSLASNNTNNGITVATAGPNVVLGVDNAQVANNGFGLVAAGATAGMLVRRSFITSNATGLFTASGGVILSYGDNSLNANTADGVFTGPIGLQ
jgi:hypothetical protein